MDNNQKLGRIISIFFKLEQTLKIVHWTTESHAVHETTQYMIDNLRPLFDDLVEETIGSGYATGITPAEISFTPSVEIDLESYLKEFMVFMGKDEISKMSHNETTVSDIIKVVHKGLYKLSHKT